MGGTWSGFGRFRSEETGRTIDHLHMSGDQWREGVDHEKGIEE